ncbi:ferredoxin [Dietzia psychralcaliphila]|uniref:ferredoxin n=1 Tax=Dietzia psychralcaliphila TaxID=139021 RepID=UPI001C1E6619|nr:ferredoxin [Dietzia psychralcaliphila]
MTFVIAGDCLDIMDKSCMTACPVDCIYEGSRKLYINPEECIDCGACEPVCPVEAISQEDDVPEGKEAHIEDNKAFFSEVLPGRDAPLGWIGGAREIGPIGVDTPMVAGLPKSEA